MPNRSTHLMAGGPAGAVVGLLHPGLSHLHPARRLLLGLAIGLLGSAMPDILEPADSPSHRGSLHSVALLGASVHGSIRSADPVLAIFAIGYASHLALDASTPAGLPLFAKGA